MFALLGIVVGILVAPFKSHGRLEAENVAVRYQVMVFRSPMRGRVHLSNVDRLFLVWLYRCVPSIAKAVVIVQPETLVRWHRAGFRCCGVGSHDRGEGGHK